MGENTRPKTHGDHLTTNPTENPQYFREDGKYVPEGLTKREHFAAQALQALLTRGEAGSFSEVCARAIRIADMLIDELNKEKDNIQGHE